MDPALHKTIALLCEVEQTFCSRRFYLFCLSVCLFVCGVCGVLYPTRSILYHFIWTLTLCDLLNPCYNKSRWSWNPVKIIRLLIVDIKYIYIEHILSFIFFFNIIINHLHLFCTWGLYNTNCLMMLHTFAALHWLFKQ